MPTIGDITGDLAARRGGRWRAATTGLAGQRVISGRAPLAELAEYQTRLNGMTSGAGRYTLALSHYDAVPSGMQRQLMAAWLAAVVD